MATFKGCILVRTVYRSTIQREGIVAFPWQ